MRQRRLSDAPTTDPGPGMPSETVIRGRCACGRRYRIRNGQAGVYVTCPACGRSIAVTEADLRIAAADASLMPIQADAVEAREAILVDHGELRLAGEGSRPGLTGRNQLGHDEALLLDAMGARYSMGTPTPNVASATALNALVVSSIELDRPARDFISDVWASFYFAGIPANALNILIMALGSSLGWVMLLLPFPFTLFVAVPFLIVQVYCVQFFWSVLRHTAHGEDQIPWVESDWGLWEDFFKPTMWMATITFCCCAPALVMAWLAPGTFPGRTPALWALLAGGWLFWPVAVMSVALGESILFIRPDWLVRCMLGIGPAYLLAWVLVMGLLVSWAGFFAFTWQLYFVPILGVFIVLYLGYVIFRVLGLLFRHFGERFPWQWR